MDVKETFADSVAQIHLAGGMVRLDLATVQPAASQDGKRVYVPELRERVIMNLEGFLQSYATMQRFVNQLVESGIVKATPPAAPKAETKGKPKEKN